MGFFDWLPFHKKEDEFDFSKPLSDSSQQFNMQQSFSPQPQAFPDPFAPSSYQQPNFQQNMNIQPRSAPQENFDRRDMEILSSKLDAVKALLDSMNQRVANIERIALQEEANERKKQRGW